MKRATTIWHLIDRASPWLQWWQELIINWISTWRNVGTIVVTSADGTDCTEWNLPSDIDLQRQQLEELL